MVDALVAEKETVEPLSHSTENAAATTKATCKKLYGVLTLIPQLV